MIVLHAGIYEDTIVFWGEVSEPSDLEHSISGVKRYEPCANSTQLRQVLRSIGIRAKKAEAKRFYIPTRNGTPVPSDDINDTQDAGKGKSFSELYVETITLGGLDMITLLCKTYAKRVLEPGILVGADLAYLSEIMRLASSMVARQQYLPSLIQNSGFYEAVWMPVPATEDYNLSIEMSNRLPGAVLAFSYDLTKELPQGIFQDILAMMINQMIFIKSASTTPAGSRSRKNFDSIHTSWLYHLRHANDHLIDDPSAPQLLHQISEWQQYVTILSNSPLRLCFRLEEPEGKNSWFIRYMLQSREDPSLLIPADDINRAKAVFPKLSNPHEFLLVSLGQASGIFSGIATGHTESELKGCFVDVAYAHRFLTSEAPALEQAGYGVILPSWWIGKDRKINASAVVRKPKMVSSGMLNLETVVQFDWRIALSDKTVTLAELQKLADAKSPLVQIRGEWVEVSSQEIKHVINLLKKGTQKASLLDVIKMRLGADSQLASKTGAESIDIEVTSKDKEVSSILAQINGSSGLKNKKQPKGLKGRLRSYQGRGFSWLAFLTKWGLGACLADDMGLGKTIQTLALILQRKETGEQKNPFLLVCPTSVISNWQREAARFTPDLNMMVHHGTSRSKTKSQICKNIKDYDVVITSYTLLQKDIKIISGVQWDGIILDEAQNVKNPETRQSKAVRSLKAHSRIALTGTPVENNVGDLWSIMDFLNPGFLGTQASFKRNFFIPIQSELSTEAAERLRRATGPFILRRLKTDKSIIKDLPEKIESKTYCQLTKEQVSLYEATIKNIREALEGSGGIERKGAILGLLAKLKQICDHPALFLKEVSGTAKQGSNIVRSGKISRLTEMLYEIVDAGENALVFTQFVEMGHILRGHIRETLGCEVFFLHGGTTRTQRDLMIHRFQETKVPAIFVISLKAGGTGLNLTAANHVFHFDRWWNPAVEDQATDRAFRIGQKKNVQVYKMICSGTLEERIDDLMTTKKHTSDIVVGSGEGWLTKMSNEDLQGVLALSTDAVIME